MAEQQRVQAWQQDEQRLWRQEEQPSKSPRSSTEHWHHRQASSSSKQEPTGVAVENNEADKWFNNKYIWGHEKAAVCFKSLSDEILSKTGINDSINPKLISCVFVCHANLKGKLCCRDQVWLCLLNHRALFGPRGKIKKGPRRLPVMNNNYGRSCHKIIALLPKLGADEIAYINPCGELQCISRDPNHCIITQLLFSSSGGPDTEWAHANRVVLSCLLKEVNEKEMAEFPGEWSSAFYCSAAHIAHLPHISYANFCV